MPTFKNKDEDAEGWLTMLLALRLRQIEATYPDFQSFVEKSGLSRGTLHALRSGKSNPTLVTIERLARCLDVPVWSLLARSGDEAIFRRDVESYGLDFIQIEKHVEATRISRKSITSFKGMPSSKG